MIEAINPISVPDYFLNDPQKGTAAFFSAKEHVSNRSITELLNPIFVFNLQESFIIMLSQ